MRDSVQAQGFLSPQPISGAPATFWSSAAVDLRYRFKAYLSSAAVDKSLIFLRYRFKAYLSSAAVDKIVDFS